MSRRQLFTIAAATAAGVKKAFSSTSTDGRITLTIMDVDALAFGPLGALIAIELIEPGAERVFVSINDGAPHDAIKTDFTHFFCLMPGGKADDIKKIEVAPVTLYLK